MSLKEHFSQIQKVLNAILKDKAVFDKFMNLKTITEKFNFVNEKSKGLTLECSYSSEEFEKYMLFIDLLNEIGQEKSINTELAGIDSPEKMYNFLVEKGKLNNAKIQTTESDFMAFIESMPAAGVDKIPPESLGSVSGGRDFVDSGLEKFQQYNLLFRAGQSFGEQYKILKSLLGK